MGKRFIFILMACSLLSIATVAVSYTHLRKAIPALIVSACMNTNPMMIYFGQEFGELGMDSEGFSGRDGRTTIFDYWSVDTIRRWRNGGKFDGKMLTEDQKHLRCV